MKYPTTIVLLLCSFALIHGQGIIRGKITDDSGEDLTGATIVLKDNITVAAISDFEGAYNLRIPSSGSHVIRISFIGHQTVEDTVIIETGKVTVKNYILPAVRAQIDEAVVYYKADKSKDLYMMEVKMKSATSIDYISKETIKKTGDSQVDDAIKRVTGVSTVQGFVTVRGLADRYVRTTINGARISTLDPLTNNIKLDMFPTSLIDNIIVTKTQSADLPGDWTGAYISIETKDYPDKFMVNIKTSVGYNPQTTFKNVVSSGKSPTDWLGYDKGYRDIDHSKFSEYYPTLTPYQIFTGLGLEEYNNSLGINSSHIEKSSDNVYYKLNLVELGLLAPGQFYDVSAISEAGQQLVNPSPLYKEAFTTINTPASEFGQMLPENWMTLQRNAPLSFSQDFSIGNQVMLFGHPLGILGGFRYAQNIKSDPNSKQATWSYDQGDDKFIPNTDYSRNATIETNEWSALIGISFKINPFHSVSLLYMPNMSGMNRARLDSGFNKNAEENHGIIEQYVHDQVYEERQQMVYQFQSNHYIPAINLKLKLLVSFTDGESSTPDFKSFTYGWDSSFSSSGERLYVFAPSYTGKRRYRYLNENVLDIRFSGEMPIDHNRKGLIRKIKFGASYLDNTRETGQYIYLAEKSTGSYSYITDPSTMFNKNSFRIVENSGGSLVMYYYYNGGLNSDMLFNYGYNNVSAAYLMTDYEINTKIRVTGGLRIENTNLFNDVKKYHELGLPENDPGRKFDGESGQIPGTKDFLANPANIQSLNYIPSFGILCQILSNDNSTLNARISYSKSLARPSIREVSPFFMYDYDLNAYVFGNPFLKMTFIDNYDIRFEAFFQKSQFISLSFFLKQFINHIEMVKLDAYQWSNASFGEAYGIEVEGKKELIQNLSLGANVTLVRSNTKVDIYDKNDNTLVVDKIDRTMFGQAPYIINGLLDYTSEKYGISAALSYNVQGPKIALASKSQSFPDVYELPMHRLDFKISKSVGKHFGIEFKMRNILKQSITRAYYYEGNYDKYPYDSYHYGTDYIFSISYDL